MYMKLRPGVFKRLQLLQEFAPLLSKLSNLSRSHFNHQLEQKSGNNL